MMAPVNQNVSDQLHSLQFSISPEERQLLGITEEDLAAFSDEGMQLTPREIEDSVQDIIERAYEEIPQFRALVDEDAAKDPSRLRRSSKVVSKLLKHLRGVLPPEKKIAISSDAFSMAHGMVRDTLSHKLNKPEAPVVQEEKIEPITDQELSYFGLKRDDLTDKTRWGDIKNNILYFLGKLKNDEGKTVKNEATKSMPDDMKIQVLEKLFNDIRDKKLQASDGKLSPSDQNFVGRDIRQLKATARGMVVPSPGKPDPIYNNDLIEVNSQAIEALKMMDRIQDIVGDQTFTAVIDDLTAALDTALPSASLFEDRINSIQEQISDLGLSKTQRSALTEVDPDTLSYGDPVKKIIEEQRTALQDIQKQISEKGESEDLLKKQKHIQGQIKQLEELSTKDISGLKGAIEDYLDTLRAYKENISKNISDKKLDDDQQKKLIEFRRMVDPMALIFSRLSREELFRGLWAGRSGMLVRAPMAPQEAPETSPMAKMAAGVAGYSSKLEKFRGKGLGDAYNEIQDIVEDENKLPAIKGKLIDILGMKDRIEQVQKVFDSGADPQKIKEEVYGLVRGTVYGPQISGMLQKSDDLGKLRDVITKMLSQDLTVQAMSQGVSQEDIGLGDALKIVNRLRSLVKKLNIENKASEALDIIKWAATLQNHIKGGKKSVSEKLASAAFYLRKIARQILSAEDGGDEKKKSKHYQSPAGVGSDQPMKSPGRAGWLIFRERMTKMGKKALQSFFEEPTFIQDFVKEMEKAGLNKMLLHGGDIKEMDIEPVLDSVIQKVTGKKGDLENILMSKTMQKYNSEYDIGKTKRELEEARDRVQDLNAKISETEDKYLPKLEEFGKFIKDPIHATREQLKDLRGKAPEKGKKEDKGVVELTDDVKPQDIGPSNYRSVLRQLSQRYMSEGMDKQAKDIEVKKKTPSEMSKMLPSKFIKIYMVWKKQLKDAKANIDREEDPYKKAVALERYYSFMLYVVNKISDYVEYQDKVLSADDTNIKNIEAFLKSDASKDEKEKFIKESEALLSKLKGSFSSQKKIFEDLKKAHSKIKTVGSTVKDQLDTIRDDISDKKVDMVYQVAISPDLVPDKETAREIKKQYKEHEKGLSYIIDRSTYKNNMNRLMTYKRKMGPFKSYPGQGVTVLPPERKKGLEDSLKAYEDRIQKIKDQAEYGMGEIALQKAKDDLKRYESYIEQGKQKIKDYTAWVENIDYLKKNKDTIPEDEYKKQIAALSSLMEGKGVDIQTMKRDIKREQEYLDHVSDTIQEMENKVERLKKEVETKRPPVDMVKEIEKYMQLLYRIRGMGQQRSLGVRTPQEQLSELEKKQEQLAELEKKEFPVEPGTPGEQAYKKFRSELEHQINVTQEDIKNLKTKMGVPMAKQAAIEDTMPDKSPFEKALDKKGVKPAPYMQELPKPKGWDIVENFFNEVKREHRLLKGLKEEGKSSPIQSKYLQKRIDQIENMTEAIDDFKNQKVMIGGDPVVFRDVMVEFEETLSDYQELLTKYTKQRDAAVDRVAYLQQMLDHYNEMYDSETGEFKGLDPEEIANLKAIFIRMLYRDLDRYWSTKVGKDLSVFGERDTNWYNNVFQTFKKVAKARSNKKMLALVNKYKQETRSDFDDMANRFKSQQLEKERDKLLEGFKEFGVNPEISTRIKDLNTRIETLKKQEEQIKRIFEFMGTASLVDMQAEFEEKLRERAQELGAKANSEETLKPSKAKLGEKADEKVNEAIEKLEKELPVIDDHAQEVAEAEKDIVALKGMREERGEPVIKKKPEGPDEGAVPVKVAYGKDHRDFNLRILYGSYMQQKIAEMLSDEIR